MNKSNFKSDGWACFVQGGVAKVIGEVKAGSCYYYKTGIIVIEKPTEQELLAEISKNKYTIKN